MSLVDTILTSIYFNPLEWTIITMILIGTNFIERLFILGGAIIGMAIIGAALAFGWWAIAHIYTWVLDGGYWAVLGIVIALGTFLTCVAYKLGTEEEKENG